MKDYGVSLIRTVVPAAVGAFLAWLAGQLGIVIDEGDALAVGAVATAVATGAWYVVVRFLEQKVPALGWLLGLPKPPSYQ